MSSEPPAPPYPPYPPYPPFPPYAPYPPVLLCSCHFGCTHGPGACGATSGDASMATPGVTHPASAGKESVTTSVITSKSGSPPSAPAVLEFNSGYVHVGYGHYMETNGTLTVGGPNSGQIAAQTLTECIRWFGGFHGAVTVIFANQNDAPVFQTPAQGPWGVEGTEVPFGGPSKRTEAWFSNMTGHQASEVSKVYIFQYEDPDSFEQILQNWANALQGVAQLVGAAGAVATAVEVLV
jgi:hypothetical protein